VSGLIMGMMLQGDVSYWVAQSPSSEESGSIRFDLWMFSGLFRHADVKFQYRLDAVSEWLDDAVIISDNAASANGSSMFGVPCSPAGTFSTFRWRHSGNAVGYGSSCEIRLAVSPSPVLFSRCVGYSFVEAMTGPSGRILEDILKMRVVNRDGNGNLLCVASTEFVVADRHGRTILTVPGLSNPVHAQEKAAGNYLVLCSGDNRLLEIDETGTTVRSVDTSAIASAPPYFWFDESTGNVFLSGGSIPKVYEISWDPRDYGTVLWSHGQALPGSGVNQLDAPEGIMRHFGAGDVVLIADWGNSRVVVVDRAPPADTVSLVGNVSFGSAALGLHEPLRVLSADGWMHTAEGTGEQESFSPDRTVHPALVRAVSDHSDPDRKDEMAEYGNVLFKPVIRPLEG